MGPLGGVRILDFSAQLPGPYCTRLLAEMGARVVKVERPLTGDPARQLDPPVFEYANQGKESIVIDLKASDGLALARRLVPKFDVVVEGFRPGVAARLGIGFHDLVLLNKKLIYCSISGYGQTGPYAPIAGHDLNYQAIAGWRTQGEEREASLADVPIGDLSSGAMAALSICAALHAGEAQYIDISITDCLVAWGATRLFPPIEPTEAPVDPAYGIYECLDGAIAVGAVEQRFWVQLCQAVGLGDIADDPKYRSLSGRRLHGVELRERIAAKIATDPLSYWINHFSKHDVPASPVNSRTTVATDPHMRDRPIFKRAVGPWPASLFPWPVPSKSSPTLGEHTEAVLSEFRIA